MSELFTVWVLGRSVEVQACNVVGRGLVDAFVVRWSNKVIVQETRGNERQSANTSEFSQATIRG